MSDAVIDLVDSYGTRLAAIQTAGPGCFTMFDRALQRVGATCDQIGDPPVSHPMEVQVQGRACMATDALESSHYLVRLLDPSGPPAGAYRELQGFVRRDQLTLGSEQTTVGGATYSPQELAEAAYSGCGPAPPSPRRRSAGRPRSRSSRFPGLPSCRVRGRSPPFMASPTAIRMSRATRGAWRAGPTGTRSRLPGSARSQAGRGSATPRRARAQRSLAGLSVGRVAFAGAMGIA